ncbi:MAG: radical SAM protein [Planctomycetota bacterium]|jgi:MoaA/NifB/PqqE/SkfB family radical SAM enzyme
MKRLLALAGALRRGAAADGLPYKLTLILNSRCPTRCTFCSIWQHPQADELTPAEWEQVFAAARRSVWVNLSGGEIFLRPDLPAILDALTARMPRLYLVDFPTTGYCPDRLRDACERLVRGGVRRVLVTVSLDGPPELHDELRGRAGAHARACAAMRALRAAGLRRVRAYFGMTLLPENHTAVAATIRAARERVPGLTARDFHFNLGMESGHYYRNLGAEARPPREAWETLRPWRRRGLDPVSLLERAYQRRVPRFLRTGRSPVACAALRASVFVDSRGVVYPCSIYDRPLGSLREYGYDLGRVLRADEARDARATVVADACPGCWTPCEAYPSLCSHLAAAVGLQRRDAQGLKPKKTGIISVP